MVPLALLRNLRVLMIGRNRLTHIDGLDALSALEVLDLHANRVRPIASRSTGSPLCFSIE